MGGSASSYFEIQILKLARAADEDLSPVLRVQVEHGAPTEHAAVQLERACSTRSRGVGRPWDTGQDGWGGRAMRHMGSMYRQAGRESSAKTSCEQRGQRLPAFPPCRHATGALWAQHGQRSGLACASRPGRPVCCPFSKAHPACCFVAAVPPAFLLTWHPIAQSHPPALALRDPNPLPASLPRPVHHPSHTRKPTIHLRCMQLPKI